MPKCHKGTPVPLLSCLQIPGNTLKEVRCAATSSAVHSPKRKLRFHVTLLSCLAVPLPGQIRTCCLDHPGQGQLGPLIILLRCSQVPVVRLLQILRHSKPLLVHQAEVITRGSVP